LSVALAALTVLGVVLVEVGCASDDSPPAKAEKTPAERAAALEEQARLWQDAERLRRDGKPDDCFDALAKAVAVEKELFAAPTHTLLYLNEHLSAAADRRKDADGARRARLNAVAIQAAFLGDHPGKAVAADADLLRQALEVRQRALGPNHRLVGHTLVDLALAEEAGKTDETLASLDKALAVFGANPTDPGVYPPGDISDVQYHLDRVRLMAGPAPDKTAPDDSARRLKEAQAQCDKAEAAEAKGDLAVAISQYGMILNFTGFGGTALTGSERTLAEAANGYHVLLGRYLSFAARSTAREKKEPRFQTLPQSGGIGSPPPNVIDTWGWRPSYQSLSLLKAAIFTRTRVTRLEGRHPALRPFSEAHDALTRRLAAAGGDGTALRARLAALEAEMGRRRSKLPQFLPAVPSLQLPPGAALVDYLVYDYTPLPEAGKPPPAPERRLACFVSGPKTPEAYLDLGPLSPVEDAAGQWRRALQNPQVASRGVRRKPLPTDGDPDAARRALRERIWAPLSPHLDKAEVVFISPDGPLSLIPFAALPGAKPGTYLLEDYALAVAPIPRLVKPLISQTDFLARRDGAGWTTDLLPEVDASPLLVGDVDFAAAPEKTDKSDPDKNNWAGHKGPFGDAFPPLPGTAREVAAVGGLFTKLFPGKRPAVLTGAHATKAEVCKEAPAHRWLHLATHGYFDVRRPAGGADLPELRSALALAGASSGDPDGVLTALEAASLDLDGVDLVVLSACETGLGDVREGEGVLGLQRAFLAAGAPATVTSLWQVDDDGTQALMAEFYRNLWERKLDKLEALRQAQLALLRGKAYAPPYYWAAFTLGGDRRMTEP